MSSWLLEVSGNFLSIEAILCYLVFTDPQLAIALFDVIGLNWGLSSNWNTTALRLATFLSLLLAIVALGWSTAGSYSELLKHVIEPLNISMLTV